MPIVVIEGCTPRELEALLLGRRLAGFQRKGKYLWWQLDKKGAVLFHFGMTGGMAVQGKDPVQYKR